MESVKKLIKFLNIDSHDNYTIKPSWDGHKWITLVDLPSIGKFGLGVSENKMSSVEMAIDHAVLFVDDYYDNRFDKNLNDDLDYKIIESPDGSIALSVHNVK